jgi:hypothetical protein
LRGSWITAAVVSLACIAVGAGSSGAGTGQLPRGWWKGTVVLEEDWNRVEGDKSISGSAMLRVTLTGPESADYELEYAQQVRGLADAVPCPDQVEQSTRASLKTALPVRVEVNDTPAGAQFFVVPRRTVKLETTFAECLRNYIGNSGRTDELQLNFVFESRQPDSTTKRRGSDLLDSGSSNGGFPSPKASATWDLTLVRNAPSKRPLGKPINLDRPLYSQGKGNVRVVVPVSHGPLLDGGAPVKSLDRHPQCRGRIAGGVIALGYSYISKIGVGPATPARLGPLEGQRVRFAVCSFELAPEARGKTIRGTMKVVAGGRTKTKAFSVVVCDWYDTPAACNRLWRNQLRER